MVYCKDHGIRFPSGGVAKFHQEAHGCTLVWQRRLGQ